MGMSYFLSGNDGTMMSGLVGEMNHQILPNVSPLATVVMTLVTMAVSLRQYVTLLYYALEFLFHNPIMFLLHTISRHYVTVSSVASIIQIMVLSLQF